MRSCHRRTGHLPLDKGWKADEDACAARGRCLDGYRSAMDLDDLARDRQPETNAAGGAASGLLQAVEGLEDRLTLLTRYSRAVVIDSDLDRLTAR